MKAKSSKTVAILAGLSICTAVAGCDRQEAASNTTDNFAENFYHQETVFPDGTLVTCSRTHAAAQSKKTASGNYWQIDFQGKGNGSGEIVLVKYVHGKIAQTFTVINIDVFTSDTSATVVNENASGPIAADYKYFLNDSMPVKEDASYTLIHSLKGSANYDINATISGKDLLILPKSADQEPQSLSKLRAQAQTLIGPAREWCVKIRQSNPLPQVSGASIRETGSWPNYWDAAAEFTKSFQAQRTARQNEQRLASLHRSINRAP